MLIFSKCWKYKLEAS